MNNVHKCTVIHYTWNWTWIMLEYFCRMFSLYYFCLCLIVWLLVTVSSSVPIKMWNNIPGFYWCICNFILCLVGLNEIYSWNIRVLALLYHVIYVVSYCTCCRALIYLLILFLRTFYGLKLTPDMFCLVSITSITTVQSRCICDQIAEFSARWNFR